MRSTLTTQRDSKQATRHDGDNRVHVSLHHLMRLRHQATGYSFLPRQPIHSLLAGRHASRLRGRGLNFEELRRYQPGDDVRTIDWHVTARTRIPHVRVYTEERDRPMLLVVDQRSHMFFGSADRMKSVTAAELAALGAWRALEGGDRVGGVVIGDQTLDDLRPQNGQAAVMHLLGSIVRQNESLSAGKGDPAADQQFNRGLEQAVRLAQHDSLVIIISDFLGADATSEALVSRLSAHNDVLGVLVHDPLRAAPPTAGRGLVTDGELQLEVDFSARKFARAIREDFENESTEIRQFLRKLSAPLLVISTAGDPAPQVRALLGGQP